MNLEAPLCYHDEDLVKKYVQDIESIPAGFRWSYVLEVMDKSQRHGRIIGHNEWPMSVHAMIRVLSKDMSFEEMVMCTDITALGDAQDNPLYRSALLITLHIQWFAVQYLRHGRRLYEVSPGLSFQLENTELRGLKGTNIRLPYKAIYLSYPGQNLQVWNPQTSWHPLNGVTIVEEVGLLRVLIHGKDKAFKGDDANIWFPIPLDDRPLDDILDKVDQDFSTSPGVESQTGRWRPVFSWAMNMVLYATWPDADIDEAWVDPEARKLWQRLGKAKGTKREKIKAQLGKRSKRKYILLGRRTTMASARALTSSTGGSVMRVLVCGHWRTYWVGKGRTTHARRFIEPHWRGLGDEEIKSHKLV